MIQAQVRIGEVVVSARTAAIIAIAAKAQEAPVSAVVADFRVVRDWVGHKMSRRATA
jgi:hypothetical protein